MSNTPRYVGFLEPNYNVTLQGDSGAPLNLTGCTANSFTLTLLNTANGTSKQGAGVWSTPADATGAASYAYAAADLNTPGIWAHYTTVKLPAEPSPREFDPDIITVLPGTVGAGAAPAGVLPAPIAKALFFNATDYGLSANGISDDTAAINATLLAAHTAGGGIVYVDGPTPLIKAPLVIYSNTTLMLSSRTTITLAQNSSCNMLRNAALQNNRRIIDGVTNSTTTFTSATAAFVAGDVGKTIRIYYQDGTFLDTTIASVTNGTTAILSAAATRSQTGLYAYIGTGRDSNIRVVGGAWYRSINNYTGAQNGWESNSIRFRHCDILEVGNIIVSNYAGKYAVNVGDCTGFSIHDITAQYNVSDTVHVNGPCSWGAIERITSYGSADDIVGMTCADFHNQAQWMGDCMGNITDVSVHTITTAPAILAGTTRAVLIQAGQSSSNNPFLIDRIEVRDVRSQLSNYAVYIGPDPQDSFTQGGTWGRLLVDRGINTSATPPGGFVAVRNGVTATDIEVRSVFDIGAATYAWVETGAIVTRFVTVGIASSFVSVQGTVTTTDIIDLPVTIAGTQTITGNKTFSGTTQVADITVVPNAGQGTSATVFLNNQQPTPQIWQFNCATDGSFNVYDQNNANNIFKVDSGATVNALEIANGSMFIRETLRLSSPFVLTSSLQGNRVAKTANYTANQNSDFIIGIGATAGAITITLPNINWGGQIFVIKDEAGGAATHNITVQGSGGQTIDGGTVTISTNFGVCRVYSTGAGWAVF